MKLAVLAVFFPVFDGCEGGVFFEDLPEGVGIVVTYFVDDLVDRLFVGFELLFGVFYFYALHVFRYGVAGVLFEFSFKGPPPYSDLCTDLRYGECFGGIFFDQFLRFEYLFFAVLFLPDKNGEGMLAFPFDVDLKHFGGEYGHLPAEMFLNDIEQQVEVGITSTTGVDTILFGDDGIIDQFYFREHGSEFIFCGPVDGAFPLVEQTGGREEEGSDTKTDDLRPGMVLIRYPLAVGLILLHRF